MRLSLMTALFLISASAFAGEFKTLKIVDLQTRNSAIPGLLDVAVTFERDSCFEDFTGIETTIIPTETAPRNPSQPIRGHSARQIRVRAVGEFGIRACASTVQRVARQTVVIQVGAVVDNTKISFDKIQ
jgi:hypothetical protein